jgi:hypothetical protein
MTQSPSNVFAVCRLCNVLCAAPALLCFHSSLFRGGHARIVLVAAEREASQRGRTRQRAATRSSEDEASRACFCRVACHKIVSRTPTTPPRRGHAARAGARGGGAGCRLIIPPQPQRSADELQRRLAASSVRQRQGRERWQLLRVHRATFHLCNLRWRLYRRLLPH